MLANGVWNALLLESTTLGISGGLRILQKSEYKWSQTMKVP